MSGSRSAASFRDPDGFVVYRDNAYCRYIAHSYKEDFDHFTACGLSSRLRTQGLLIDYEEAEKPAHDPSYKVLKSPAVPFVSYPYEWCFSQLKSAALTTLRIQREALKSGMTLKDASAYNIQFVGCRPLFIDLLSFRRYEPGGPWEAYRQFCQHFLAPLLLISRRDASLTGLLKSFLDGIPLAAASKLLDAGSWLCWGALLHIHLHARSQTKYELTDASGNSGDFPLKAFFGLLDSLESAVESLRWEAPATFWGRYYCGGHCYEPEAFEEKKAAVAEFLDSAGGGLVWDIGANQGVFSRIAAQKGMTVVALEADASCVEQMFVSGSRNEDAGAGVLPLVMDICNPSPAIGWENRERLSLTERSPVHCVMALALLHHLAIANNLSFGQLAAFLAACCQYLIIEFIPKSDPQAQRLLRVRRDIFSDYTVDAFERAFGGSFDILGFRPLLRTQRVVYLMRKKG